MSDKELQELAIKIAPEYPFSFDQIMWIMKVSYHENYTEKDYRRKIELSMISGGALPGFRSMNF